MDTVSSDLHSILLLLLILIVFSYFFYTTNNKLNDLKEILSNKDLNYSSEEIEENIKEKLKEDDPQKLETIGENDNFE